MRRSHQTGLLLGLLIVCVFASAGEQVTNEINTQYSSVCEDEFTYCPLLSKPELGIKCVGIASEANRSSILSDGSRVDNVDPNLMATMLSHCMTSCKRFIENYGHKVPVAVKHFLAATGGLTGTFKDIFGYEHDICNTKPSELIPSIARLNMFRSQMLALAMMESSTVVTVNMYSVTGLSLAKVPNRLFKYINGIHSKIKDWIIEPTCNPGVQHCYTIEYSDSACHLNKSGGLTRFGKMDDVAKRQIGHALLPLAEAWIGMPLRVSTVYGIRRYLRGAYLAAHVDKTETHIVSAIINVAQSVDDDWPLDIYDHSRAHHKIILKPGDLLWYEGAKLPHGRVQRLNGNYYDNIFIHYVPLESP